VQVRGSLINNLKQLPDGRWTWKHDRRRGIRRDRGGEMDEAAWAALERVEAPTLLVRGAESNILSEATAARMRTVLRDSRFVEVPNAGHLVPSDNPVAFEQAVRAFLGV
jgi:pimeloyl-ACP methyl ester carboxylesterase